MSRFKQDRPFNDRLDEASRVMVKYPDRVPVICEKLRNAKNTPDVDKNKYLVPNDLTVGQFLYVVRKRIRLNAEQALYLFVNGSIPPTSEMLCATYMRERDADGFLYVEYACENTFGLNDIKNIGVKMHINTVIHTMHPHLNNIQYGGFEFVIIYILRWIQAWVYYGFVKLHRSVFRGNEPNQIEMVETVKSMDEKYVEKYHKKFLKTFETDDAIANSNVHRIFYDMEEYKKAMTQENNELEQEWKRRILLETTPRGNIAISFDPYRMAFVYYSDQTMNYKVLNAAVLQYCTMFRCRDLFMDEFMYPEGKTSPLVELHKKDKDKYKLGDANAKNETKNLPHNLKDAPFAKLKSKGVLPPANNYNKSEKPVSSDATRMKNNHAAHKPQIMNTFVHLGKMANYSLFQITKKTPIETVPDERKKMSYKEYMASLGQPHFQFQYDNKDYFGLINEETKLKLCISDSDIVSNMIEDMMSDETSNESYVNVIADIATTKT